MVIIVHSFNCKTTTMECLNILKQYCETCNIILADNASTDGLSDWASEQDFFTYVYMDEGHVSTASMINSIIKELNICDDVLIIDGNMVPTEGFVEAMCNVFANNPDTGMVGVRCNSCADQFIQLNTYETACEEAQNRLNHYPCGISTPIITLSDPAVMIRLEVLQAAGDFDEDFDFFENSILDYSLKALQAGFFCRISEQAIVYDRRNTMIYHRPAEADLMERKWGIHYINTSGNPNVIEDITHKHEDSFNVLEIGCDCGATLLDIKNRYPNAHIYGSELNVNATRIASYILDDVKANNIEEYTLEFGGIKFDYIIFADVLEHLRNPLGALEYVKTLLNPGGTVIASIPNLMNISVMKQLLNGWFTYEEYGLLDKTHIHMFTYNEIVRMFKVAGYKIDNVATITSDINEKDAELINTLLSLAPTASDHMYTTFQYIVKASV